ncbi:carboxylesterase family protein [Paenarthrobacter nitroguajacolicus]|uniref:carboxylesterase/lipase family protein n=1 Tax=Paenarthrobacter nitroguajacolicus TaxID=211146 RepID=UPI002865C7DC|nr:carboxylesterase family protein [Paenarthrobacter nitroguajacolicus]MDR6640375.1 para-nitrobenzyl esterase [Paenarthrobacter nitroguajacolicus]
MTKKTSVVHTTYGQVQGFWRDGSASFLNLPYAQDPVGDLRFEAPVPPESWSGIRPALEYGPTPQRRTLSAVTTIPEPSIPGTGTLNLNVFTPTVPTGPGDGVLKPVLVWIHGGGFVAGSPASPWYDGAAFNRDGVVVVTISYRLGFEGFGWLPDAPLNRGMLDWIAALKWVRSNIAAFGGNPEKVTIGGQSAGGGAVISLRSSPLAAGLFSQALIMSGAPLTVDEETARATTARIAAELNVPVSKAGFQSVTEEALLDAQMAPFPAFAGSAAEQALDRARFVTSGLALGPITEDVDAVLDGGASVTTLLGTTRDEFAGFIRPAAKAVDVLPATSALERVGASPDVAAEYAERSAGTPTSRTVENYLSDLTFRRFVPQVAGQATAPVWTYQFQWEPPASGYSGHCVDLPFAFGLLEADGVEAALGANPPVALAESMHAGIVAFCKDGNPGWTQYGEHRTTMIFDDVSGEASSDPYSLSRLLATDALGRTSSTAGARANQ